ncbi:MAG: hypothetical protein ACLP5V_08530 [Candidatus Bathyarchaeia archaeon]
MLLTDLLLEINARNKPTGHTSNPVDQEKEAKIPHRQESVNRRSTLLLDSNKYNAAKEPKIDMYITRLKPKRMPSY